MGHNKKHKSRSKQEIKLNIKQDLINYNYTYQTYKDDLFKNITPRNKNQKEYLKLLNNNIPVILAIGPAGTGKTFFSTIIGLQKMLNGDYDRIVLCRPVSAVDEDLGYLPGTFEEKLAPWIRPIYDILMNFCDINSLMNENKIEICPLGYMRGRTFNNTWIIADEMQNSTPNQMKMLLTRMGNNSKMIITGDLQQTDIKIETNGLKDFFELFENNRTKYISKLIFNEEDIQRNNVVKEVLKLYNDKNF